RGLKLQDDVPGRYVVQPRDEAVGAGKKAVDDAWIVDLAAASAKLRRRGIAMGGAQYHYILGEGHHADGWRDRLALQSARQSTPVPPLVDLAQVATNPGPEPQAAGESVGGLAMSGDIVDTGLLRDQQALGDRQRRVDRTGIGIGVAQVAQDNRRHVGGLAH